MMLFVVSLMLGIGATQTGPTGISGDDTREVETKDPRLNNRERRDAMLRRRRIRRRNFRHARRERFALRRFGQRRLTLVETLRVYRIQLRLRWKEAVS